MAAEGCATIPNDSKISPGGEPFETSSGDEDVLKYIVKLKLPRRQKSELDKRLRSLVDQAAGLSPNCEALGMGNGVQGEELPAPAEPITNLIEKKEEACTSASWTSYFSYKRQISRDKPYVDSSSDQFDSDTSSTGQKAFTLMKSFLATISVMISSPYLRQRLLLAFDIEFYNGVAIGASNIVLDWPFSPLYHHLGDVRADIHVDPNATSSQRNEIDALQHFVTEDLPAKLYEDVKCKISQGFIQYKDIWALFKPGDLVVSKDPVGNEDISRIVSVKRERNPRLPAYESGTITIWYVKLVKIAWKGGRYKKILTRWRIESFTGSQKITNLELCPLWCRDDRDLLRDAAIQRGKLWKKFHEDEPTTMMYVGQALCFLTDEPLRSDRDREGEFAVHYNTFTVSIYMFLTMNAAHSSSFLQ